MNPHLIFSLDQQKYAIDINFVHNVVPAVALTPIASPNNCMLGLLNLHGQLVPVFDMRRALDLDIREIELSDQIIICHTKNTELAITADRIIELQDFSCKMERETNTFQISPHIAAAVQHQGQFYYIIDVQNLDSVMRQVKSERSAW